MPKKDRLVLDKNRKIDEQYIENASILWMPISVGQDYHEGEKLKRSLDLIMKRLKNTILVNVAIVDIAQRYHLAIKNQSNPEDMLAQAVKNAEIWKKNYGNVIESKFSTNPVVFFTWDIWLNHEFYAHAQKTIEDLYCENEIFANELKEDVSKFERRHFNRENRHFTEKEKEYCIKCLKEECAVLIAWDRCRVSPSGIFLFYPKALCKSMLFIKQNYTQFISLSAEFKTNKSKFFSLPNKVESGGDSPQMEYKK